MEDQLREHLSKNSFPCIMAKSVLKNGVLDFHHVRHHSPESILDLMGDFVFSYRSSEKLHSFILGFPAMSFGEFEEVFWKFLLELKSLDHSPSDYRVDSDPYSPRFSYSLHSEGFFILMLHPDSPRLSRRTKFPAIVFNPHQQFEDLRRKNIFTKVRDTIRVRDLKLQGKANPMLHDFGVSSEIFQYTGKKYQAPDHFIEEFYANYPTANRNRFSPYERLEASGY
ncbi:MAG: guanitoxin biosynthesis heme-dependent pre-guanitoxin N-hydroxylase GntA [Bdellovibrionota bacterium]